MKRANEACNWISGQAFENKIFKQFNLQKLVYRTVRETFHVSAQTTIFAVIKVADAYKLNKTTQAQFRPLGAIWYDHHSLSFKKDNIVSIWTIGGREHIPFAVGEKQKEFFSHRKGQVGLVYKNKTFYLNVICDITESPLFETTDVLGVDFGIVNIISDSDGEQFSGKDVECVRQTFAHRRRNLQRKGTKSAKRKLKQLSGKQSRYQKLQNHVISKQLVTKAKDTCRAIALEDLSGIRDRITVRKSQRNRLNNWSFYDLKTKIEYKAKLNGVPVIFIDPRNTSRQCSSCSHISKSNRKSQAEFVCKNCGHTANADFNAALNIRARGEVNHPNDN